MANKIACPRCASAVQVENSKKSKMVVCLCCGSVLALRKEGNEVLCDIATDERPRSVLLIGSSGSIKGAKWKVLGRVRYKGDLCGEAIHWDEYCIFNGTRGYAWLREREGRWQFAKEMRRKPSFSAATPEIGEKFEVYGMSYVVLSHSKIEASYLEGEFNERFSVGEELATWEALSSTARFEVRARMSEELNQTLLGERISPEKIASSFGVEVPPERSRRIPEIPLGVGAFHTSEFLGRNSLTWAGLFSFVFLFLAFMTHILGSGESIYKKRVPPGLWYTKGKANAEGFTSKGIEIKEPTVLEFLYRVPSLNNDWVWLETEILDEEKDRIHYFSNEISYYSGSAWSEGHRWSSTLVSLEKPGKYHINLCGEGERESVELSLRKDVFLSRYFFILLFLLLVFIVSLAEDGFFKRWAVSGLSVFVFSALVYYMYISGVCFADHGGWLIFLGIGVFAIVGSQFEGN